MAVNFYYLRWVSVFGNEFCTGHEQAFSANCLFLFSVLGDKVNIYGLFNKFTVYTTVGLAEPVELTAPEINNDGCGGPEIHER